MRTSNSKNRARICVALILALVGLIGAVVLVLAPSRRATAQAGASWSYTGNLKQGRSNHTDIAARRQGLSCGGQYFGYLRRNPNDPPEPTLDFQGYNFWLTKLDSFNGNFIQAEMVKAFLNSTEYRQRFGQP